MRWDEKEEDRQASRWLTVEREEGEEIERERGGGVRESEGDR